MDIYGYLWIFMDIYGYLWIFMAPCQTCLTMADVDLSEKPQLLAVQVLHLALHCSSGQVKLLGSGEKSGVSSKILRVGVSTGIGSWDYWKELELMIVAGLPSFAG